MAASICIIALTVVTGEFAFDLSSKKYLAEAGSTFFIVDMIEVGAVTAVAVRRTFLNPSS